MAHLGQALFSLTIISFSVVLLYFLGQSKPVPTPQDRTDEPAVVEVSPIQPFAGSFDLETTGVSIPARELAIVSQVAGKIIDLSEDCKVGRNVRSGQILAKVDPTEYEIEIKRLQGQLAQSQASLNETQTEIQSYDRKLQLAKRELDLRTEEYDRMVRLQTSNAISKSELSTTALTVVNAKQSLATAEDSLATLRARVTTLETGIAVAQEQLNRAQLDLSRTDIVAPLGGVIVSENLEIGQVIHSGAELLTVQDSSEMEVRCSLHMKQLQWLWKSEATASESDQYAITQVPVTVTYQLDGVDWHWQGVLEALDGGRIDEQTRMAPCRVRIQSPVSSRSKESEPRESLRPTLLAGMFVNLQIHITPVESLLRVPASAVQPGAYAWAVRDGKLQKLELQIAHATDQEVLIHISGDESLAPGDQVVVSPIAAPLEGYPADVRKAL